MDTKHISKLVATAAVIAAVGIMLPPNASGETRDHAMDILSSREASLTGVKFEWKLDETKTGYGYRDPDRETYFRLSAERLADQFDFKDTQERRNFIEHNIAEVRAHSGPYIAKSTLPWTFQSDDRAVLVTARMRNQTDEYAYRVVLGPTMRMLIPDEMRSLEDGATSQPPPAKIFSAHRPSWCYRDPGIDQLSVTPEQVSLFCGKNPQSMYGATWKTVYESAGSRVIEATYQKGQYAPYTVTVRFDDRHSGCPSRIDVEAKVRSEEYQVTGFRQFHGAWVPETVHCAIEQRGAYHVDQEWRLEDISPALPVIILLAPDADASDYRLLGPDITAGGIIYDEQQSDHQYVSYQFRPYSYKVPSLDDLIKMRDTYTLHRPPAGIKNRPHGRLRC